MATQRCPQLLLGLPQDVLATRIAALLPPDDRQASNGGRNLLPPARSPLAAANQGVTAPALPSCMPCPCRLHLSHACRALRAASSTAGWFPVVRVALDEDTDAQALGAWLRRTQGECEDCALLSASVELRHVAR